MKKGHASFRGTPYILADPVISPEDIFQTLFNRHNLATPVLFAY